MNRSDLRINHQTSCPDNITDPPPVKIARINQHIVSGTTDKSIHDQFIHGYQRSLEDAETMLIARKIVSKKKLFPSTPESMKRLRRAKQLLDDAIDRLKSGTQSQGEPVGPHHQTLPAPKPAAKHVEKFRQTATATCGYKKTSLGVIHGTGVKATRPYSDGEKICDYNGPLVYRIRCRSSNDMHYLFTPVKSESGLTIKALEDQSQFAWPGVKIVHSGNPAIEIGRDCNQDIRYLNHSKNDNVEIIASGFNTNNDTITWKNREALKLNVIAKREIKPGDELLMDYDERKSNEQIDFTLSSTMPIPPSQQEKIIQLIDRLESGTSQNHSITKTDRNRNGLTLHKDIEAIVKKIETCNSSITTNEGRPMLLQELDKLITARDKAILKSILLPEEPDIQALASVITGIKKDMTDKKFHASLRQNLLDLKLYLENSIFNNHQTLISAMEIKELLSTPAPKKVRSVKSDFIKTY